MIIIHRHLKMHPNLYLRTEIPTAEQAIKYYDRLDKEDIERRILRIEQGGRVISRETLEKQI